MDQASKLRSAIIKKSEYANPQRKNNDTLKPKGARKKSSRVICISSGKGGVGKTNFTLNTAIALSKKGFKTLIIDADLGLANIEVLLGITPKYTFMDIIEDTQVRLSDIMVEGPLGINIISGGAGISESANLPIYKINRILNAISILEKDFDYILIDTGAGLSNSVISFAIAANEVIIVTLPEPTAIADAYALIKVLSKESSKDLSVVVNNVDDLKEADFTFKKLEAVAKRFLNLEIKYLGYISSDKNIRKAVKQQEPFYMKYSTCEASKNIDDISLKIAGIQNQKEKEGFAKRLSNFFLRTGRR